MIGISFYRVFKAALQNQFRNIWLTLATLVIMTITLLIVQMLFFANVFGLEVLNSIEKKVDLSATFQDGISQEKINEVVKIIENRNDVQNVKTISSDEALLIFKQRNLDKPFIEESLKELEENPLPASIFIVATEPRFYEMISKFLETERFSESIDTIHYEDSKLVIDRLISLIDTVKNTGFIITIVFGMLVVLIMFNTVRLAIYSCREEIDIMHLVGASRWYIRGPFIIESVLIALISVVIASAIAFPIIKSIAPQLESFFFEGHTQEAPFNLLQYVLSEWSTIIGLQVAVAVGLAVFSSVIALQRYLKT
jgi:cell division transport system permease protein